MTTKACTLCGGIFPATNEYFYHTTHRKDGLTPRCRECLRRVHAEQGRKYRQMKKDGVQKIKFAPAPKNGDMPFMFHPVDIATICADTIPDNRARLLIELQKSGLTPLAVRWVTIAALYEVVVSPLNFQARQSINERLTNAARATGWLALPVDGNDKIATGYVTHFSIANYH